MVRPETLLPPTSQPEVCLFLVGQTYIRQESAVHCGLLSTDCWDVPVTPSPRWSIQLFRRKCGTNQVDNVRFITPTIHRAPPGVAFAEFASLSSDNVAAAIARLPDKSSAADPQRVDFKMAAMAFRVLHGLAPPYLNQPARVADLPSRCRLRSASSHQLLVPPFRLTTVGRLTFPVTASLLWNSLPSDIQASSINQSKFIFQAIAQYNKCYSTWKTTRKALRS